jgi:uncharacterized membrane protein
VNPPPARIGRAIGVASLVLVGALLRLHGMGSELWFDEIVSVKTAAGFHSALDVFRTAHTDNKHHLISLWIRLVGPNRRAWVYRLPSFFAGVAVLPLIWIVARKWISPAGAWIALVLATFCGPLLAYSSEARGYSLAVFFAVTAFATLPTASKPSSRRRSFVFISAILLGFLSNLTFAFVYGGLFVWTITDAIQCGRRGRKLLLIHIPIVTALALLYAVDISSMTYAGGQATSAMDVVRWTAGHVVGSTIAATAMAAVAGPLGLWWIFRRHGIGPTLFFITAIFLLPIIATITRRTPFLAGRYFLVCYPFAILVAAAALARLGNSLPAKLAAIAFIAPIFWNGSLQAMRLHDIGRGRARDVIHQMTAAGPSSYDTERPQMDSVVIDYSRGSAPLARQPDAAPDWWILDLDDPLQVGPDTLVRRGRVYRIESVYPAEAGSGLTWDLYRRADSN